MTEVPRRCNRLIQRQDGYFQIRLYHRKGSGKKGPRYLLKCGCCDQRLEIHYGYGGLEINGVMGSIEDWREILLPLLGVKLIGTGEAIAQKGPAVR